MATQEVIEDVGAAAEAFTADDGAPLHQIESLCMRCGENVCNSSLTPSPSWILHSSRSFESFVYSPEFVSVEIEFLGLGFKNLGFSGMGWH